MSRSYVLIGVMSLALPLFCFLALIGFSIQHGNQAAFIDMQKAMSKPAMLLSKTGLSQEKQKDILKIYASNLADVIKQYGKERHVTIINATILSSQNNADITDDIISITLKKVGAL